MTESIEAIAARVANRFKAAEEAREKLPLCPVCQNHIETQPCPICADNKAQADRLAKERLDIEVGRLGGLKAVEQFTLERYTNKSAIDACKEYPKKSLFIWGAAGTGKTHLATALVRKHNGSVVKPQTIFRSCRGLKDGEEEQKAINKYVKMPFLVIDDLGIGRDTEFSFSVLYEIIEGRDMSCIAGLIITSNLSMADLSARLGDDRITSRIIGMSKVIELTGKDWRVK